MVRLKVGSISLILMSKVFQFHYGTIKRKIILKQKFQFIYFNSIMVRLKAASPVIYTDRKSFQFHYGTIKSKKVPK